MGSGKIRSVIEQTSSNLKSCKQNGGCRHVLHFTFSQIKCMLQMGSLLL